MQQVKITIVADVGEAITDQSRAGLAKMIDKALRESSQAAALDEARYFTPDCDILVTRSIDVEFVTPAKSASPITPAAPAAPVSPVIVAPIAVSPNVGLAGNIEIHLSAAIGSMVDPSDRTVEGIAGIVRDAVSSCDETLGMSGEFVGGDDSGIAVHKITVSGIGYTSGGQPVQVDRSTPVERIPPAPQSDQLTAVHDKVYLQLSRPALDRLIGGDSEIEVKLRQGVVEDFCNRKLKSLVNEESIKKACGEIEAKLHESVAKTAHLIFGEIFERDWDWGAKIAFPRNVTARIQEEVHKMLGIEIVETTKNVLDTVDIGKMISERVDASVKSRIDSGVLKKMGEIMHAVGVK
jgi:hypothetical protein